MYNFFPAGVVPKLVVLYNALLANPRKSIPLVGVVPTAIPNIPVESTLKLLLASLHPEVPSELLKHIKSPAAGVSINVPKVAISPLNSLAAVGSLSS